MLRTLAISVFALAIPALAADYTIDTPHTDAQFSVRHMMVSNVKGNFNKVTGTVTFDDKNSAATKIDAVIDATTINTREPQRDGHLKSPDFFDVAKFPTLTFKSTSAKKTANGVDVTGELTIHGVTRSTVLHVTDITPEMAGPNNTVRRGAAASTVINRKDFGLVWNHTLDTGGVAVGDEVTITIDVEVTGKKS